MNGQFAMRSQPQPWAVEAAVLIGASTKFALQPELRYHTTGEATTACPFCREGEHRFIIFIEGNYFCRKCEKRGWWRTSITDEEKQQLFRERDEKRQETRRRLQACTSWKTYHENVYSHLADWQAHGIDQSDIDRWQLGYAERDTTFEVPSLTIPVFFRGNLVDIRHRLLLEQPTNNKYRSHFRDTPPSFFNGDVVTTRSSIFLVEGEKKAIILEKYGISPAVSYPGVNMQEPLLAFLHDQGHEGQEIIYIPDPNTIDTIVLAGRELARMNRKVSVVEVFLKPDDLLIQYGQIALKNALKWKRRL